MRQFPKELLPITEKDIIKEVAEELGYTEIQVTDVYRALIEALDYIDHHEDAVAMNLCSLGTMFISLERLKVEADIDYVLKKTHCILANTKTDFPKPHYFSPHEMIPIVSLYGTYRLNRLMGKNAVDRHENFTVDELIRRQNKRFCVEDCDYRDKNLYDEFFYIEPQKPSQVISKSMEQDLEKELKECPRVGAFLSYEERLRRLLERRRLISMSEKRNKNRIGGEEYEKRTKEINKSKNNE